MDSLLVLIGLGIVCGLVIHALLPTRPPQIICVQTEAAPRGASGCLVPLLIGLLALALLLGIR